MDDFGGLGTHWVCCWRAKNSENEYFDSFGLPPPNEWELGLKKLGKKTFLRNDNQLQWVGSVRGGYHCLLFLNEKNKGKCFKNILAMFSDNVNDNKQIVQNYFS